MKKFQTITVFLLVSIFSFVSAQKKDSIQTKWTIKNCVNSFSKDKTVPTNAGYQYWFADKNFINGRTLKMSVVKPHDATHPPHKHMEDEFFFVLEGNAKFYLNGDSVICGPYTSFYCPSMVEHGISNAGDTELKYLVIKDYQPSK
jgi:mannose-6-phosphate isomerase-like protein (cupin superfamily)